MGSGSWDVDSFRSYSASKGYKTNSRGVVTDSFSAQENFKAKNMDKQLSPYKVVRECIDSEEHPNTFPVQIYLDCTGSMNDVAVEVAKKISEIVTKLFDKVKDVEFLIGGIGDMAYDECPLQVTQFESDIRIAEQMDKLYFENGGGGNGYESYSLAWYFGLYNTKLDCFDKRGKKGVIITIGDEQLNPYIPKAGRYASMKTVLGDSLENDVETKDLYEAAKKKFDIFHINVEHGWRSSLGSENLPSFYTLMGKDHTRSVTVDSIADTIAEIVINAAGDTTNAEIKTSEGISW